jgi:hypothetical protein
MEEDRKLFEEAMVITGDRCKGQQTEWCSWSYLDHHVDTLWQGWKAAKNFYSNYTRGKIAGLETAREILESYPALKTIPTHDCLNGLGIETVSTCPRDCISPINAKIKELKNQ